MFRLDEALRVYRVYLHLEPISRLNINGLVLLVDKALAWPLRTLRVPPQSLSLPCRAVDPGLMGVDDA